MHLLAVSPLGGVVAAVVCERHERDTVGEETRTACSGFVDLVGTRVWPVVTVGLRPIAHASESTALALADMRQIVFDTDRRSPGGVRWHEPGTVSTRHPCCAPSVSGWPRATTWGGPSRLPSWCSGGPGVRVGPLGGRLSEGARSGYSESGMILSSS